MLLPLTQQTLIVDKIESQSGYTIIKTNEIELPKDFQIILHIINPTEILNLIDNIENNLNLLGNMENKEIIWDEMELIRNKVHTIIPSRYRRGLVDGGGTLLKWIFGTMDNKDKKEIEKHLSIIDINNHNLITNMNQQIKINENFQKSIVQLKNATDEDRKQIFNKLNTLNSIQYQFFKHNTISEQMNKLNFIKSRVEHIQENIASARLNLLNPNILTKEEIMKYDIDFNKLVHIRLGIAKYLHEKIIFAIKIPKNYVILNKKIILPITNVNNKKINEKIKYCLEYNETYFEFNPEKAFKELSYVNSCIFLNNCKLVNSNSNNEIIELQDNIIILEKCTNFKMNSSCDERKFVLEGNFFITFHNCNIVINNQLFSNKQEEFIEKFVLPDSKNILFQNSLTFEETILETENNIKEIKELKYHNKITYSTIIVIIIIILIISIIFYCKQKKVNFKIFKRIQENPQSKRGGVTSSSMSNINNNDFNKSGLSPEFVEMVKSIKEKGLNNDSL